VDLEKVSRLLERVAAEVLLPRFARVPGRAKADGSLVTEADTLMQERLREVLAADWPAIPVLGEEMAADRQREVLGSGDAFWCLDPLDGTTNYAVGLPYYAVSLALVRRGEVVAGWVHDPARGESFRAERGRGAWLDGRPLRTPGCPASLAECVALVDLKRLDGGIARPLASDPPYRSQRSLGAVALDWCWLAAGRAQLYLHGRQKPWDYAAGGLVAAEAGAVVCLTDRIGGACDPRVGMDPRVGIGAGGRPLFDAWVAWLRDAPAG
jgi:myo-inositol-1(or 4)-monophosphatase